THADGLILPPDDIWMYETAQEAFIIYDNNTEILVLSSSFSGSADDFGWIIPVPNEPEVDRVRTDIFDELYELTQPKQNLLRRIISPEFDYSYSVAMMGYAEDSSQEEKTVNVIEEKRVGIYDIAVLFATDVTDLETWLETNGYNIPESSDYPNVYGEDFAESPSYDGNLKTLDESKAILQEYIDAEWYFIAVKVNNMFIEDQSENSYDSGSLNPLKITFETTDMVFPLKISGLSGQNVSLTIFTLTLNKVWVDNYDTDYCEDYFYYSYDTENNCSQIPMIFGQTINPDQIEEISNETGKGSWFESSDHMYLARHETTYMGAYDMNSDVLFEEQDNNIGLNDGSMKISQYLLVPLALLVYGPRNLLSYASNYFYNPVTAGAVILTIVLLSAIFVLLIHLKLRKTTIRSQRVVLNILQFPFISITSVAVGIGVGLIWALIQIALGISEDAAGINGIISCLLVSLAVITIFYRFQWKK
ncbi:MAG: DUF2330 domain-containing protein, partial [bacterium]